MIILYLNFFLRPINWFFSICLCFAVSKAEILGNSEIFVKSGSDINLTCLVVQSPEPPSFIYWYRNDNVINYSSRGGINVLTEKQTKTSRLLISRAQPPDSGNYTCSPSSSEPASVIVHVLNGNLSHYYNIYFTLYCRISEK